MSDPLQVLGATIFDRYDVVEVVGHHGARCVYRGLHRAWGEPVRIELLALDPTEDAETSEARRRAFVRAGKDLARLSSKTTALVQARDGGLVPTAGGELPCVVSEFVEGCSVSEAFARARDEGRARYAAELVFEWFGEVGDALDLMHGAGLVHGQVDGSSLYVVGGVLGPRGLVKITSAVDAAYRAALPGGGLPSTTGVAPPPELEAGDASLLGPWTDVYGLAAVMLELMTGETDREQQITKLPKEQRHAFEKALAPRIDARFKTIPAFWQALGEGIATRVANKKQRNPRRTMVVSEQLADDSSGSAGAFEAEGEGSDQTQAPRGQRPKARVRLAFTQVAMPVPAVLSESERPKPRRPGISPTPTPTPVPGRAPVAVGAPSGFLGLGSMAPLVAIAVVFFAAVGAVLGYLLSRA